ncbi:hemerythrin HHE cation binding domain-containing protein [Motilibacter rhizosphaerae]|uniref:Hemerythrin HHE cation binding domain-containing protein n=1 Tax=Motilibacter rhizosphaerae TaxID=598652 RepID=A0A4Q7NAJ6_9ACTN|nr:hemerythrin domain-containing protein [Motilibacter rhizosphaerae]RZS79951.1 hemerythrin HHE cation binding domain-containing protein [Motilibacter rhizosphaerae]
MTTPPLDFLTAPHAHTSACWWSPAEARWVCTPSPPEPPLVDVRDMLVVHTALLREFRLAPAAVSRTPDGDRRQARAVAGHLRFVGDMLHHHHEGEDELLWPLLVERAPDRARLLADGEAQHAALDLALTDVARLRDAWAAAPDAGRRDALAARLETLSGLLRDHLDLEERDVLPVAAAVLRPEEWAAIGARGAASMSKPDLALAFGMFAYEGDPAVLAEMLHEAPAPVRLLMPRLAPRVYARRARQVHGTPTP